MARNKMSPEEALAATKGLWSALVLEEDDLKLNWFGETRPALLEKLGPGFNPEVGPEVIQLAATTRIYTSRFPRLPTAAAQKPFEDILNPPPEGEQPAVTSPRMSKINAIERAGAEAPLEVFQRFCQGLAVTAEFLAERQKAAKAIVKSYSTLKRRTVELKEDRVGGWVVGTDKATLVQAAKEVYDQMKNFKSELIAFGETESMAMADINGAAYLKVLGANQRLFSWAEMKKAAAAVLPNSALAAYQVYDNIDYEDELELQNLFDSILNEIDEVRKLPDSSSVEDQKRARKTESVRAKACELVESMHGDPRSTLDVMDDATRYSTNEEVTSILANIRELELDGVSFSGEQVSTLKAVKFECVTKESECKEKLRAEQKAQELQQQQQLRAIPTARLPVLEDQMSWLSWLTSYQSLAASRDITDERRKYLILQSLNKEDKVHCVNQPLAAIVAFLHNKYHNLNLIVQMSVSSILKLPQPRSFLLQLIFPTPSARSYI